MKNVAAKLSAMGLAAALALTGGTIAVHEGYVPGTYYDPVGILTACFGHVSPTLRPGQKMSDDECLRLLADDLVKHNDQLLAAVRVPLSEQEHAAYLSFHYNVGSGNFRSSTLLRHLNAGFRVEACNELSRWVFAKGIKLPGLITRRANERDLCLQGAIHVQK
ncbi:lysozyme [Arsukibacterium indicum]|uniref:Lysozyme n=1 Tax=Arsukibacterium indicum TaxID=2848612 RepID=A0ABS6MIL0_9GAMM|nr:lysozyme [Arsukibacterium indicum]MBV2128171.1 lysozyme [Arsukibacterium indicum]